MIDRLMILCICGIVIGMVIGFFLNKIFPKKSPRPLPPFLLSSSSSSSPSPSSSSPSPSSSSLSSPSPSSSSSSSSDVKMALLIRSDLKMKKGKICAQCGHASLGASRRSFKKKSELYDRWVSLSRPLRAYAFVGEDEILALREKLDENDINHYLVQDAGRTQIAAGSYTVLAIGPAESSVVDQYVKGLRVMGARK